MFLYINKYCKNEYYLIMIDFALGKNDQQEYQKHFLAKSREELLE